MLNLMILGLCAGAVGWSYRRLMTFRCLRTHIDPCSQRCWNCGMSARDMAAMSLRHGIRSAFPKFYEYRNYSHPFNGITLFFVAEPVENQSSPYAFKERCYPPPEHNTPQQIETWRQMTAKQGGYTLYELAERSR